MSIRFASFEAYKNFLADKETGKTSVGNIFICPFHRSNRGFANSLDKLVFLGVNSWPGRWRYGSCRRRVSDGGCEDSASGPDALPR